MHDLSELLRRHPFCEGLSEEHLALLVGCATNEKHPDGTRLFRHGEDADRSYLLRDGRVALEVGERVVETAEAGDLVGWSWLFPPFRFHFDARAVGPVRVIRLDGICLRRKCEDDPRFGFEFARRALRQATRRLERSRLASLDLYGPGARR